MKSAHPDQPVTSIARRAERDVVFFQGCMGPLNVAGGDRGTITAYRDDGTGAGCEPFLKSVP